MRDVRAREEHRRKKPPSTTADVFQGQRTFTNAYLGGGAGGAVLCKPDLRGAAGSHQKREGPGGRDCRARARPSHTKLSVLRGGSFCLNAFL